MYNLDLPQRIILALFIVAVVLTSLMAVVAMVDVALELDWRVNYADGTPAPVEYVVWEDGSFVLGRIVGCLPLSTCR